MSKPNFICTVCGQQVEDSDGPFIDCNGGKECVITGRCCNVNYTWHYEYTRKSTVKD